MTPATTAQNLLALAERVEAATGPDRRLDTLAHIARYPDRPWIVGTEPGRFPQKPIWGKLADLWNWAGDEAAVNLPEINAPAYTVSLDAAMSLIERRRFIVAGIYEVTQWSPYGGDHLRKGIWRACVRPVSGPNMIQRDAATPALALTAAALRARSGEVA